MREIKSIAGLRVISVDEGANCGAVSQVVVDLARGLVLGITIGSGASERGVIADDIQTIGTDVVMVYRRENIKPLSDLPDLEDRVSHSQAPLQVITASGRRLGIVSAVFIDPLEKVVISYEVSSGPLKDLAEGVLILPIVPGTVHGEDCLIVPDDAVRELGRETGGLFARFSQWGDTARKQVQVAAGSAEKLASTSAETLKKEAAVVKQRAGELTAKAKEAAQRLTEKEDSGSVAEEQPEEQASGASTDPDDAPSITAEAPVEPAASDCSSAEANDECAES